MCNSGLFTEKHVFQNCIYFQEQRIALIDRVKNVKSDNNNKLNFLKIW